MSRFKELPIDVTFDFIRKFDATIKRVEIIVLRMRARHSYSGAIYRNWNYHEEVN